MAPQLSSAFVEPVSVVSNQQFGATFFTVCWKLHAWVHSNCKCTSLSQWIFL